jgi:hypothetical protein
MKKLSNKLLMMLALCGIVFFYSCDDDDDPAGPSVTLEEASNLISEDTTVREDTTITVQWTARAGDSPLETFLITINDSTFASIALTGDNQEEYVGDTTFIVPDVAEDTDIEYEFTAIAEDNSSATDGFVLTVLSATVETASVVLLEAPIGQGTDNQTRTSETFYSTTLFETYSYNEVVSSTETISEEIDFGYYFGATTAATLAGISRYPTNIYFQRGDSTLSDIVEFWNVQRNTQFRTTDLSVGEFDAIGDFDDEEIAEAYEMGGTEDGRVGNLTVGDVVAFQTRVDDPDGGKFGLLKVTDINPGSGTDGYIQFELKIEAD